MREKPIFPYLRPNRLFDLKKEAAASFIGEAWGASGLPAIFVRIQLPAQDGSVHRARGRGAHRWADNSAQGDRAQGCVDDFGESLRHVRGLRGVMRGGGA